MRNEKTKITTDKAKTAKRKTVKTHKEAATDAANRNNGSRPKRKPLTTEEITLKAFQKVYESHHQETA